jgi:hypothetical protein
MMEREDIVWFVKCNNKLYKCATNPAINKKKPSISHSHPLSRDNIQ